MKLRRGQPQENENDDRADGAAAKVPPSPKPGMPRISFKTPPQLTDWPSLRDVWLEADDIPVYAAGWLFDHFYPIQGEVQGPCLEGWTTLTALAALTKRLRLGVMVTGNTYRHPAVLSKMAATLDVVSGGRLEIGLGAGWNQVEADAYGLPMPALTERFDRLNEACEVIDSLLTQPATTYVGKHYALYDARCEPKPLQRPRPPIVIGGGGERRTIPIAARWADHWNLSGGDVELFRRKLEVLHRCCHEIGRDPASIEVSVQLAAGEPSKLAQTAATFTEAGAQHIVVVMRPPFARADLEPIADALSQSVGQ